MPADNELVGDCFPAFNDVMRLDDGDTDSDMPYLIGPSEIRSVSGERQERTVQIQHGEATHSAVSDADTSSWVNPTEVQETVAIHNM